MADLLKGTNGGDPRSPGFTLAYARLLWHAFGDWMRL